MDGWTSITLYQKNFKIIAAGQGILMFIPKYGSNYNNTAHYISHSSHRNVNEIRVPLSEWMDGWDIGFSFSDFAKLDPEPQKKSQVTSGIVLLMTNILIYKCMKGI